MIRGNTSFMKKIIFLTLFIISSLNICNGQDVIVKTTGENIQAKVLEIGLTEIRYLHFDNPTGPTYVILKSEVSLIKYANGTRDNFTTTVIPKSDSTAKADSVVAVTDFFLKGRFDSRKYYKGYHDAGMGTFVLTLVSPEVGLATGIICSSLTPKGDKLNFPNAAMRENPKYNLGYTQEAMKIKQHDVWEKWGIAMGINTVAVIVIISRHYRLNPLSPFISLIFS